MDCEPSCSYPVEKVQSETEIEHVHILTTCPPIIENLFKYLNARDLCSSARVCTLWNRMACTEKRRRKDIVWFCKVGLTDDYVAPSHVACHAASVEADRMELELGLQMKDTMAYPALCTAFASSELLYHFPTLFPNFRHEVPKDWIMLEQHIVKRRYMSSVIKTALKPHLPARCPLVFAVGTGVTGCGRDLRPVEVESGAALSGFFLPSVPGLEVYHYPINYKSRDLYKMLPEGRKVKCLLVFLTSRGINVSEKLLQSCLLKERCHVAVGGAIVERAESAMGSVIALCGASVNAASVVILPTDKIAEVKDKLKLFRESGLLRNQCVAYMFTCLGRGYRCYREHNVESGVFHRMYPNVPLAGMFGNGEIGITYFPHIPTSPQIRTIGKLRRSVKKYLHSYTTVFVMISIET